MYTLPFTKDSVDLELDGKTVSVGKRCGKEIVGLKSIKINDWHVYGGVLYVNDDNGRLLYRLNSVSCENGRTFLVGDENGSGSTVVMRDPVLMRDNFEVFISSNKMYEPETKHRIIRSLARDGLSGDRILFVRGGVLSGKTGEEVKLETHREISVRSSDKGNTALRAVLLGDIEPVSDYVLFLHDTCEVMSGFLDAVRELEVGIPYDFMGLFWELSEFGNDIGFWSSEHLRKVRDFGFTESDRVGVLDEYARNLRYGVGGNPEILRSKDIYGDGLRAVTYLPSLKVKKYKKERYK